LRSEIGPVLGSEVALRQKQIHAPPHSVLVASSARESTEGSLVGTCCGGAQAVAEKRVSTTVEQLETQSYTIAVTQPSIALHASVRYPVPADNEAWLGSSAR
jgi:hypothetical protein